MVQKKNQAQELENYIMTHQESIYRLAYSYVKNPEDALDIVQDSIIKVISSVGLLKDSQTMKTWVYRIVVNTALDFLRKQKRLVVVDDETLNAYIAESAVGVEEYSDLDLAKAVDELPPVELTRIVLRYYEDLTIEEVAYILKENVNTTKSRLYRTLKKLRLQMTDPIQEV